MMMLMMMMIAKTVWRGYHKTSISLIFIVVPFLIVVHSDDNKQMFATK